MRNHCCNPSLSKTWKYSQYNSAIKTSTGGTASCCDKSLHQGYSMSFYLIPRYEFCFGLRSGLMAAKCSNLGTKGITATQTYWSRCSLVTQLQYEDTGLVLDCRRVNVLCPFLSEFSVVISNFPFFANVEFDILLLATVIILACK